MPWWVVHMENHCAGSAFGAKNSGFLSIIDRRLETYGFPPTRFDVEGLFSLHWGTLRPSLNNSRGIAHPGLQGAFG